MNCRVLSSVIRISRLALVLPAVLLDHVGELDDVLALLVLLARLESLLVLPPERSSWHESNVYVLFEISKGWRLSYTS